jgi:hypothetical protein
MSKSIEEYCDEEIRKQEFLNHLISDKLEKDIQISMWEESEQLSYQKEILVNSKVSVMEFENFI